MNEQDRADLRRKIAEELGWRVKMIEGDYFALFDPMGERVTWGHLFSENEVWDTVLPTFAPSWTTDLNAALALPIRDGHEFHVVILSDAYVVAVDTERMSEQVVASGKHLGDFTRIARAVCDVWVEYRMAAKDGQS